MDDNASIVDMGEDSSIHPTFNIGDMAPYHVSPKLRTIHFEEGRVEPNTALS